MPFHTVPQVAKLLTARHGVDVPHWRVRRIVDSLDEDVPRFGPYRLVADELIPSIEDALREINAIGSKKPVDGTL